VYRVCGGGSGKGESEEEDDDDVPEAEPDNFIACDNPSCNKVNRSTLVLHVRSLPPHSRRVYTFTPYEPQSVPL